MPRKFTNEMLKIPSFRDLQYGQAMDYPTVGVDLDREQLGQSGVTVQDVSRPLLEATSSSRFVIPNYWADLKNGLGYQVQVQVPPREMESSHGLGMTPIKQGPDGSMLLLRDVAKVQEGTAPGEYDRLNLRRLVSLTANIEGSDLGRVTNEVDQALRRAGDPPRGVRVEVRGQVAPMRQMFNGLALGLALAVVAIFLLLTAYFQSPKLALTATAAVPAVLAGVAVSLYVTHTTLNIQSFMGAIMAIGVAVANAILLVTFAERHRRADGAGAAAAAVEGARHRLRPILMTSCAMLAGMVPMALALGEGGEQTAPLGRAVIGGLVAATLTTLLVLPAVFAAVQGRSRTASPSLDPSDPESVHYHADALDREHDGRSGHITAAPIMTGSDSAASKKRRASRLLNRCAMLSRAGLEILSCSAPRESMSPGKAYMLSRRPDGVKVPTAAAKAWHTLMETGKVKRSRGKLRHSLSNDLFAWRFGHESYVQEYVQNLSPWFAAPNLWPSPGATATSPPPRRPFRRSRRR